LATCAKPSAEADGGVAWPANCPAREEDAVALHANALALAGEAPARTAGCWCPGADGLAKDWPGNAHRSGSVSQTPDRSGPPSPSPTEL
jgi:hypothetical protein